MAPAVGRTSHLRRRTSAGVQPSFRAKVDRTTVGATPPVSDDVDPLLNALMRARPGEWDFVPVDMLQALLGRPEWHRRAACRGVGAEVFYGGRADEIERAKALCSSCPVCAECLEAGVAGDEAGVWGGTTARDRRAIRSRSAPAA